MGQVLIDADTHLTWTMDLGTAESVIQVVQARVAEHIAAGQPLPRDLQHLVHEIPHLQDALTEAFDAVLDESCGCAAFTGTTLTTVPLDEPALIGGVGTPAAVLLPGDPDPVTAATKALAAVDEHFQAAGLYIDDRMDAVVHDPDWYVLYACEAPDHSFHPAPAPDGPATPGAVQVTLVTFEPH